ncbi:hypothetical protein PYW07_006803 [Mythimna separata]|uniref:Phospholipid scramblase n=1 Tax=Mythimna separata TaxID=271217 RepID=A0AAD7YZU0_MYTSE|nr:hypothetical protein PYW07_006803 [Mythimna separata]
MAAAKPPVAALERLSQLSTFNLKQTSMDYSGNKYTVFGEGEEVVLTMTEMAPNVLLVGRARRPFEFDGMDSMGRKLFAFRRPMESILISKRVELFMDEKLVNVVHIAPTMLTPIFTITDGLNNPILRLKGKKTDFNYFQLQTNEKVQIGAIQRTYPSFARENYTLIDNYTISVPVDLAATSKLAVIVACVFIDFIFHEGK